MSESGASSFPADEAEDQHCAGVFENPPVLILDEATSALDNESERLVQASLERLTKGRTTFTVAHRLSTIQNAKVILVLTENGIEEMGTHEQLMEKRGVYYRLYRNAGLFGT